MNKRAHIRHAVSLMARLSNAGPGHRQCRVEDFCLGGVLVRFVDPDDDGHGLQPDQPVELTLAVDGNRGQREITLPARVARVLDDGAGLRFDEPNPADLLSLQNHVRAQREDSAAAVPAGARRVAPEPVLQSVGEELREALTSRVNSFFDGLRDTLQAPGDGQASPEDERSWNNAGERLEAARENITREFLRRAQEPLQSLSRGQDPGEAMDLSGGVEQEGRLSVVDKEWFQDWLTLKVMASRAESHFHEQLLPLQLRFNELLNTALAARQNPLHPVVICSAFGRALKPMDLNRSVERRVMEIFDTEVLSRMGPFYEQVNATLIRSGVLPELDVSRYLSDQGGHGPGRDGAGAAAVNNPGGDLGTGE